jgi:hypothetical protein
MKSWFERNKQRIIATTFLIPILLVAFVSISHVTVWYGISNPITWATYLSLAVEIAALSALAGMTVGMRKFIYVPFGIVTLIQLVGNIFYSFHYIDLNSETFKSWVDLVNPLFSMMGVDDANGHRRILAVLSGGMLPLISLTFLHMLVKSSDKKAKEVIQPDAPQEEPKPAAISAANLQRLEDIIKKKSPLIQPDPIEETPSVVEKWNELGELHAMSPEQAKKFDGLFGANPIQRINEPEPTYIPEPPGDVAQPPIDIPSHIPSRYIAAPAPTPTPSPSPTHMPTPTHVKKTNFTQVGQLLKKLQYDNPNRRQV